jgi:N-sulfoglucosamine sulfohydrolase
MVTWADVAPTMLEFAGVKPPKLHGRSFLGILDEQDPEGWDTAFASHTFHEVTMYYPMRAIRTRKYKYILNLAHPLPFPFASDLYDSETWQAVLKRRDETYGGRALEDFLYRPQHELYDLEADPGEVRNLAADAQHAGVLKDLQQRLREWRQATADPWVIKYEHE